MPLAMLQEMNANVPITFVVVTKRQCVIAHTFPNLTPSQPRQIPTLPSW